MARTPTSPPKLNLDAPHSALGLAIPVLPGHPCRQTGRFGVRGESLEIVGEIKLLGQLVSMFLSMLNKSPSRRANGPELMVSFSILSRAVSVLSVSPNGDSQVGGDPLNEEVTSLREVNSNSARNTTNSSKSTSNWQFKSSSNW